MTAEVDQRFSPWSLGFELRLAQQSNVNTRSLTSRQRAYARRLYDKFMARLRPLLLCTDSDTTIDMLIELIYVSNDETQPKTNLASLAAHTVVAKAIEASLEGGAVRHVHRSCTDLLWVLPNGEERQIEVKMTANPNPPWVQAGDRRGVDAFLETEDSLLAVVSTAKRMIFLIPTSICKAWKSGFRTRIGLKSDKPLFECSCDTLSFPSLDGDLRRALDRALDLAALVLPGDVDRDGAFLQLRERWPQYL